MGLTPLHYSVKNDCVSCTKALLYQYHCSAWVLDGVRNVEMGMGMGMGMMMEMEIVVAMVMVMVVVMGGGVLMEIDNACVAVPFHGPELVSSVSLIGPRKAFMFIY